MRGINENTFEEEAFRFRTRIAVVFMRESFRGRDSSLKKRQIQNAEVAELITLSFAEGFPEKNKHLDFASTWLSASSASHFDTAQCNALRTSATSAYRI